MSHVTIRPVGKPPTQSMKRHSKLWEMYFNDGNAVSLLDPNTAWVGNNQSKMRLHFDEMDQAISFAKKHNLSYDVVLEQKPQLQIRSYADNFKSSSRYYLSSMRS